MKITDTWLSAAIVKNRGKPKYRRTVDRGPSRPGLMVTVYSDGTAAFVMRYTRPSGARVFMPIGTYGKAGLSLAQACTAHDEALSVLEHGRDPIDERGRRQAQMEEARRERAGADTVASLVEQFVHRKLRAERWDADAGRWVRDSRANIKGRKRPEVAAALLGHVDQAGALPARKRRTKHKPVATFVSEFGDAKARDVTRRQLIDFLESIVARGAPVSANRVHALLVQLFTWAVAKDLIPASPMVGVERPGGEERPRQRVLTTEEVKAFWTKVATADMAEPTRLALKLLLVTAQRRGELTFAQWSHFDIGGKLWTIPVELLKTSHARRSEPEPHAVPLSPLALELLGKLRESTGEGLYVLPARADKRKDHSYSERVLSRAVRENAKHFGIAHFTPHDLRRTAASFMTKLKVPRLHVEKVLNHSTGDVAEVYDRHDYLPEKRTALEKWSEHLQGIIDGREQKVVPMVMAEPLPTEWQHTVKLAQEGDTEAARDILGEVTQAIESSVPIPQECALYVAEAFRKILAEDVEPAIALGVKSSRSGRRPGATTHDQVSLGAAYWLLVHRGRKPEDAKALLNTLTGADRRTVERAAKACSSFGDDSLFDEPTLMAFVEAAMLTKLSTAS